MTNGDSLQNNASEDALPSSAASGSLSSTEHSTEPSSGATATEAESALTTETSTTPTSAANAGSVATTETSTATTTSAATAGSGSESGSEVTSPEASPGTSTGTEGSPNASAGRHWPFELAGLFLFAMFLRYSYNLVWPHVNNFAACDAFEYIHNGRALLQLFSQPGSFWQQCIACLIGAASNMDWDSVKNALQPLMDFYISGPVYPAFIALNVAVTGATGASVDVSRLWPALLIGNSILSALTCVFTSLIAFECYGRREARVAGFLAAIYPGFIVNSGRLYSETFACCLLVALSYLTLRGFRGTGNNFLLVFLSGFLAASLQLTRSVMAALTLALIPITAMQQRGLRRFAFLLPFVVGFAFVALPWLGFQKLAFGGGGLVVDRVGHYNFFIGNNVDTAGWLSYPYPDGRNVEATSFPALMKTAVEKSPARWFRLMLDKPLRLFKYPWNDFRTAIGVMDFEKQVVFHEHVLLLACIGLGLALFLSPSSRPDKRQLFARLFVAGLFAFHCIYYLFITVPRYNLTSIPEMIVFAAAGFVTIRQLVKNKDTRKTGLRVVALSFVFFIVCRLNLLPYFVSFGGVQSAWILQAVLRISLFVALFVATIFACKKLQGFRKPAIACLSLLFAACLFLFAIPLRANGRYQEWSQTISDGTAPIRQTIQLELQGLEAALAKGRQVYLLIDTSSVRQREGGFSVSVNGVDLPGPVLPSMAFAEDFNRFLPLGKDSVQREGERMWDSLSNSAGCGNLDLRQWAMIALTPELLKQSVEKARKEDSALATFDVVVENKSALPIEVFGCYDNGSKERTLPSTDLYSWEKVFYGVENPRGLTDTRYDIKVKASDLVVQQEDLSSKAGLQNGVYSMAILFAPPVAMSSNVTKSSQHLLNHWDLGAHSSVKMTPDGKDIPIDFSEVQSAIENASNEAIWLLRLRGLSRVKSDVNCPAVEIESQYKRKDGSMFSYRSAWTPKRFSHTAEWCPFSIVVPLKPVVQGDRVISANIGLRVETREPANLNIYHFPTGEVEFTDLKLDLIELPTNPIGLGHQVL